MANLLKEIWSNGAEQVIVGWGVLDEWLGPRFNAIRKTIHEIMAQPGLTLCHDATVTLHSNLCDPYIKEMMMSSTTESGDTST